MDLTTPAPARRRRRIWRVLDVAASLLVLVLVLDLTALGSGRLPALGPAFNPGTGVWHLAADATGATTGRYRLPTLQRPATVSFEDNGMAHIAAADDADLWRVMGYVHARFRLVQMDLARRQGSGMLAAVLGPPLLDSDTFELDLGVRRAAERDWAELPAGPARTALSAYADGVNAAIDQLTAAGELPAPFKLLGYTPAPWTPTDSLVVQRLETQTLSFTDAALAYSLLAGALDARSFHAWFPEVPSAPQHPYDTGPYATLPLTPLPVRADPAGGPPLSSGTAAAPGTTSALRGTRATAGVGPLLARLAHLPGGAVHRFGASNAWAVAGSRATSGKPMLAADPHLGFSLPAVWYQVEGSSPGEHFAGVTIPGLPVPVMGRTDTLSWGITAAQRPTTLFYLEKTDPARPGQYYWRGAWRRMDTINDWVDVKGEGRIPHTVELTAHGPVLQLLGQTTAVWWAGTLPSQNVASVLSLLHAHDLAGFRESLRGWVAPAVNFVYADKAGNIGAFDAGVAPQVAGHPITLPLPGDGSADVAGSIPFEALPHAVNPPSGYVVSANQREVGERYPYQYATSYNFSDEGWRADAIVGHLSASHRFTLADFQRLQGDQHDQLAAQLVPQLRRALAGQPLSATERQVLATLSGWDAGMEVGSIAPTVLQNLVNHLVYVVFRPWWSTFKVPRDPDDMLIPQPFTGGTTNEVLEGTVLAWIRHDPTNPFLTPTGATPRNASAVLRQAFHETIAHLTQTYGADLAKWTYGSHHFVVFPSLLQSHALDDGPYSRGGDSRTINAAGSLVGHGRPDPETTTAGASWRFVIDWGTGSAASVYPGGQSESPLSPWYDNGVSLWRQDALWPMRYGPEATAATRTTWRLHA